MTLVTTFNPSFTIRLIKTCINSYDSGYFYYFDHVIFVSLKILTTVSCIDLMNLVIPNLLASVILLLPAWTTFPTCPPSIFMSSIFLVCLFVCVLSIEFNWSFLHVDGGEVIYWSGALWMGKGLIYECKYE